MVWRANDILVGFVTGLIVAAVAAGLEAYFITVRFLSFGQHGGGVGSKIGIIAIVGAILGAIVGFILGALIKPRVKPH